LHSCTYSVRQESITDCEKLISEQTQSVGHSVFVTKRDSTKLFKDNEVKKASNNETMYVCYLREFKIGRGEELG